MPHVVLLVALIWMAANSGATEPSAEAVDSTPALEKTERPVLAPNATIAGKVTQTMDVSQYTYIEVDTGNGLV